ncbi:SMP-30/gluconolactonase/LRE family protein [Bordetella holmesii]|nr:SMP-30/gluconolactonase/LRE family protein [Bordetella holmesii]AMD45346.1 gluconolactonase [Bordetella holmesii H558]AOB34233.1 gluconolactonase [Bordetella holmesii]AUL18250.1 gluconolactonase [Bordetella holmesii]AUL21564.1 gluconolactonase [Bordetella holmesii]AUL24883.1 gluconolactonase [Bordetella holmesii]
MTRPIGDLPQPDLDTFDPRLRRMVASHALERLCTGAQWSEGPVWMEEDDSLLWSDIPNNRMLRWSSLDGMTVWRSNVEFTNGHTRDRNGDLLHCSHGRRAIVRTPLSTAGVLADTADQIVVDRYMGRRLNSPNDVVVDAVGRIWFSDPDLLPVISTKSM